MKHFLDIVEASVAWRLFTAVVIGLLLGIERERRKRSGQKGGAGLRTFTLVALSGGLAAQTGSHAVIAIAVIFAAAIALYGRAMAGHQHKGTTTEVALVIAAILGVLAQSVPGEALAAAVVVVLVISSRAPLHWFAREWLTEQDMRDGILFAAAALVVLPLLPNRAVDPLGLVNPFALWRLAVVLMGVSAFSYCATRILGARHGLALSGFAGGFVSSTAVIAAMGARAKADARMVRASAAGSVASILGSLIFMTALLTAADPAILRPLTRPFAAAGVLVLIYAVALAWRDRKAHVDRVGPTRAFDLRTALIFVGLVGAFSLLSWALIAWFGQSLIFASVIGTALIDAHAAAVSVATLVASGKLDAMAGSFAILVGFSANMLAKTPTAFAVGGSAYGMRVGLGLALLVIGLWTGFAWATLCCSAI
jgi:uncharacterized membrane protein (DUF4010 family)